MSGPRHDAADGGELKVYVHREPIDMRRGRNGLAALAQETMQIDPFCGALLIFIGRRYDSMKVLYDPDDDRVLECAIDGKADYVVSGDRHLLTIGSYEGIPILSLRQFMDAIDAGL